MQLDVPARAELYRLFSALFTSASDLRNLLLRTVEPRVINALPGGDVSLDTYATAAVDQLERCGALGHTFFTALLAERPSSHQRIAAVAAACGISEPLAVPVTSADMRRGAGVPMPPPILLPYHAAARRPRLTFDSAVVADALVPGTLPPPRRHNPAALLNARCAVVPFHEWLHGPVLDSLCAWCECEDAVAIQVVHGTGGAGKTRLALELCARARGHGFLAGFARHHAGSGELEAALSYDGRVLAIFDYAETQRGLGKLLARVVSSPVGSARKLRIVLIVRTLTGWWEDLLDAGSELRALLQRDEPISLSATPLSLESRTRVFDEACTRFAEFRGTEGRFEPPDLNAPEFGKVLYVHMAAIAALEGRSMQPDSLLDETLRRERHFWRLSVETQDDPAHRVIARRLDQAVASLILAGGAGSREQALTSLTHAGISETLREALLARLGDLYPGTGTPGARDRYLSPLAPDLLADAHVAAVLAHRETPARFVASQFAAAPPDAIAPALQVLGRLVDPSLNVYVHEAVEGLLAEDLPARAEVAVRVVASISAQTLHCPLAEMLAGVLRASGSPDLASVLAESALTRSRSLAPVKEWVFKTILAAPENTIEPSTRFLAQIGLMDLMGMREDIEAALKFAQGALATSQAWVEHDLAGAWSTPLALGVVGAMSSEMGVREQAVEISHKGLAAFEALGLPPSPVNQRLALLLRTLHGYALLRAGAREEATTLLTKTAEGYAGVPVDEDGETNAAHALCLFFLAECHLEAGYAQSALSVIGPGIALQRALADEQRGSHLAGLALGLTFLAGAELRCGAIAASVRTGLEAVSHWNELAANSGASGPGLAMSLANLASARNLEGDRIGARQAAARAVELWRTLASRAPAAFTPGLANALGIYGYVLDDASEADSSISALTEAVELFRALKSESSELFQVEEARTLILVALRRMSLSDLGEGRQALCASTELYHSLPPERGRDTGLEWAAVEMIRGLLAVLDDDSNGGLVAFQSMIAALTRPGVENNPTRELLLGFGHLLLAGAYLELEDDAGESQAWHSCIACLRRSQSFPQSTELLGVALAGSANVLETLGELEAAEAARREAIELRRGLVARGSASADELAEELVALADLLESREMQPDEVRALRVEAAELLRLLAKASPQTHAAGLVEVLLDLARGEPDADHARTLLLEGAAVLDDGAKDPSEASDSLSAALVEVGEAMIESGLVDAGLDVITRVIARCQAHVSGRPAALLPLLAEAHEIRAEILVDLEQHEASIEALLHSVEARRKLARINLVEHGNDLLESLQFLVERLLEAGRASEARRIQAEARALARGPKK